MALTKVPSNLDAAVSITQSQSDNSTNVATTAYVDLAISNLSDSAPAALNTLNEIAAALGDNENYAATTTAAIADKLPLAGGAMTGAITTNSTFDGVDIATRDAILTSTTTTANAALPKAGGTMTGTLTTPTLITGAYGGSGSAGDGFRLNSTDLYGQIDASDKIRLNVNGDSFLNGGNLGIGTSAPTFTAASFKGIEVQVSGDLFPNVRLERVSGSSKTNQAYEMVIGSLGNWHVRNATTASAPLSIATDDTINMIGNVGIGETDPDRLFHVKRSDSGGTVAKFENSAGTVYVELNTDNQAGGDAGYLSYDSNKNFGLWTDDTQRMTITSDGRIGFGEGAGTVGHRDVEGKMDLRMDMSGQNWTENDWASVWDSSGTPGSLFNKSVLHLDTNRFGGASGGIVGLAFSPGWQGHQNWGIYSHNRSGGTNSEGDLSFVNQINAGNIQERFRIRADGLTVFPSGFASTPYTFEKVLQRGFSNGVANQKCYIVLGTEFWGQLEISLTGTYSNQNMTGILKRSYALGLNTSGTIYNNESHTIQEEGATANNFALGEVEYDSTLGKYKVPIAHINSAGNTLEIRIKSLLAGTNQAYLRCMQEAYVTNVITTNTTVYKKQTRESACHVYHTGGQAITATPLALSFTSTLFDPGDCFSGSEYTAPEHGIYAFNVSYLVYPHTSGVTTSSWQRYSGGGWSQYGAGIQQDHGNNSHTMISYPTLIELSKGEKVRAMLAIGGYSGTPTMYGGQNSFTAHKV